MFPLVFSLLVTDSEQLNLHMVGDSMPSVV